MGMAIKQLAKTVTIDGDSILISPLKVTDLNNEMACHGRFYYIKDNKHLCFSHEIGIIEVVYDGAKIEPKTMENCQKSM